MTEDQQTKLNDTVDRLAVQGALEDIMDTLWEQCLSRDYPEGMVILRLPKYIFPELESFETRSGTVKIERIEE